MSRSQTDLQQLEHAVGFGVDGPTFAMLRRVAAGKGVKRAMVLRWCIDEQLPRLLDGLSERERARADAALGPEATTEVSDGVPA